MCALKWRYPASPLRCFNVYTTPITLKWRRICIKMTLPSKHTTLFRRCNNAFNVQTTLCAYWVSTYWRKVLKGTFLLCNTRRIHWTSSSTRIIIINVVWGYRFTHRRMFEVISLSRSRTVRKIKMSCLCIEE